ncbi:MAG: hypothetical protein QOJ40_2190 [Verrucomicrobiota bacterium]
MLNLALLWCLAQSSTLCQTKPNGYPAAVAQSAESLFKSVRSEVSSGIQLRLNAKEIGSKDLETILVLLNSGTSKLREAAFDEKLARAVQQVENVNTQVLAVLKDPGNKEIFALGLEPEQWLNQIRLQRACGGILEKKIARLRKTIEELRNCAAILEPVTPPDQLSDRIKLRLNQLLSEWNQEPGAPKKPIAQESAINEADGGSDTERMPIGKEPVEENTGQTSNTRSAITEWGANRPRPTIIDMSPGVENVVKMVRVGAREREVLKYIGASTKPFMVTTAEEILYLRRNRLSAPIIAAMLQRDTILRANSFKKRSSQ